MCSLCERRLRDDLDDTTGLFDLLLGTSRHEAGLDDERDLWETALAEDLAVTSLEGVDDGDELGRGGLVLLLWDERLWGTKSQVTQKRSSDGWLSRVQGQALHGARQSDAPHAPTTHVQLVEVDDGPPVEVVVLVEVPHADFTEVTQVVLVEVCSVVCGLSAELARRGECVIRKGWSWWRGENRLLGICQDSFIDLRSVVCGGGICARG